MLTKQKLIFGQIGIMISLCVALVLTPAFAEKQNNLSTTSVAPTAQSPINIYTRDTVSLDGQWRYLVDRYRVGYLNYHNKVYEDHPPVNRAAWQMDAKSQGSHDLIEYDFDTAGKMHIPGDWNTQSPELRFYEGNVWFRKKFDDPRKAGSETTPQAKQRVILYFGAANYKAHVYLNGEKLGINEGGFIPFEFEITNKLKTQDNSLVVRVENYRSLSTIPTSNKDWWNYGGITRSVKLAVLSPTFIRDYRIALGSHDSKHVSASVMLDGSKAAQPVTLSIDELGIHEVANTDETGTAHFSFTAQDAELWSPSNPKQYQLVFATDDDRLTDNVGFRTIAVKGKDIVLNGEKVFLRGISIHEEYAVEGGGRVKSAEEARALLAMAQELNVNFVRLAHYPHNEHMARIAEEMGILVWSEIPVYWVIDWTGEGVYENAENQLTRLIERDKNRASVIIWSVANETPVNPERTQFISNLAAHARSLDDTRLVSAALLPQAGKTFETPLINDPLGEVLDIVSFNAYYGWYSGMPEVIDTINYTIGYDKPVIISEFGAGAKFGKRGDKTERWTEDYQAWLYEESFKMLEKIDGFSGTSPWILADFRSPKRMLPIIQDGWNRKGVYSEKGEKKQAFYVLKDYYNRKAREAK